MEWAILPERVEMMVPVNKTDQQRRDRSAKQQQAEKCEICTRRQEGDMPFGMYKMHSANIDSRILVPVMLNGDTKVNFET